MLENIHSPLDFKTLEDMQIAWANEIDLPIPTEYSKQFEFQVTPSFSKQYGLPVGARAIKFGKTIYGYTIERNC